MIYFDAQLQDKIRCPSWPAIFCQQRVMKRNLIWLASVGLNGILADAPVAPKAAKGNVSHLPVVITNQDKEEEDAGFELLSWV